MRFGQHPHVCLLAICAEAHDLVAPLGNRQPATGNIRFQVPNFSAMTVRPRSVTSEGRTTGG
jgi:hypothetical protein